MSITGCTAGAYRIAFQHVPALTGAYFYPQRLSGAGTSAGTLTGTSAHSGTCGGSTSAEDVRWMVACGTESTLFSLCASDGGTFARTTGATSFDPDIYVVSMLNGSEEACNDDVAGCTGTGGDTASYGSRISGLTPTRGLSLVYVDGRGPSGMSYTLAYSAP